MELLIFQAEDTVFVLAASKLMHKVMVWRPFICVFVCLVIRHTYHDSPGGSMRHGQCAFWPNSKEDQYAC